ncbi:MAG: FAD binding domain-containing protein [Ignavibacteria bacterium]|nr:FAD binding domain-containing protein [Ignavibacteria bacterium]
MPEKISFILNNELISTDINPALSLVDYIRYYKKLTGTKVSCREGECGACSVLAGELNDERIIYKNVNFCIFSLHSANRKHIVTIEGLNTSGLNAIQEEFLKNGALQCGFCTPEFIISLTCFFLSSDVIDIYNAIKFVSGNLCRCAGYFSIKDAISNLVKNLSGKVSESQDRIEELISLNIIPDYFKDIKSRLMPLQNYPMLDDTEDYDFLISGGTDLYVRDYNLVKSSRIKYATHSSSTIEAVWQNFNKIFISAFASVESVITSSVIKKYFKNIENLEKYFGSRQIRNKATVGGNIINSSPIGDMSNFLLSLNAEVYFRNGYGERKLLLRDLFLNYKKLNLRNGEILTKISFNIPPKNTFSNFIKISRRNHLDIASVNSAVYFIRTDDVIKKCSVSAGRVAPIPKYLADTPHYLKGKKIS